MIIYPTKIFAFLLSLGIQKFSNVYLVQPLGHKLVSYMSQHAICDRNFFSICQNLDMAGKNGLKYGIVSIRLSC